MYFKSCGWEMGQLKRMHKNWCQDVEIRSYQDNTELREIVDLSLERYLLKKKGCVRNAWRTMFASNRIGYIEGYAIESDMFLEHGWNVFDGDYHFDLTSEVAWNGQIQFHDYVEVIRTSDIMDASDYAMGTKRGIALRERIEEATHFLQ